MKIKYINGQNTTLWFTFACSQCDAEVSEGARFCHNCGHELSALPRKMYMQKAADILTDALRKEPVALAKTDEADDSEIDPGCTSGVATADPKVINMKGRVAWGSDVNLHCTICGKSSPENCEHLRKSGACGAKICTSNPPQYQMCPFRGDGFIPITEA